MRAAGPAERVTERDAAAVHVELLPRDAEVLRRRDDLRRERLVDLDEVDVVHRQPGAGERLARRADRAEPHDLRVQRRDPARHDASEWRDPELARPGSSSSRRPPTAPSLSGHALPAVTVPSGRNTGLSWRASRPSCRRRGPSSLLHHRAVGQRDRDDLALEEAVLLRLDRALLRPSAANSSISSRVTPSCSHDVLRGLTHRDVDVGQTGGRASRAARRLRRAPCYRARASEKQVVGRAGAAVRATLVEPAHALDAGGDEHVTLARSRSRARPCGSSAGSTSSSG